MPEDDPSRLHKCYAVAKQDRLVHIMCHEQDRFSVLFPELEQKLLESEAVFGVQRRKRLVQQQRRTAHTEHSCNSNALLHAAGKLVWQHAHGIGKPNTAQRLLGAGARFGSGEQMFAFSDGKGYIIPRRHPWKQGGALDDDAAVAAGAGYRNAAAEKAAAFRPFQSGEQPK